MCCFDGVFFVVKSFSGFLYTACRQRALGRELPIFCVSSEYQSDHSSILPFCQARDSFVVSEEGKVSCLLLPARVPPIYVAKGYICKSPVFCLRASFDEGSAQARPAVWRGDEGGGVFLPKFLFLSSR